VVVGAPQRDRACPVAVNEGMTSPAGHCTGRNSSGNYSK